MKKIVSIILTTVFVCLCVSFPVMAETVSDTYYVVDNAEIISDEVEEELELEIDELRELYGYDIAIATFESFEGTDFETYLNEYYNEVGYAEDGVIFGVSMGERDWYITTHGDGQWALNDYATDHIGEQVSSYLASELYDESFQEFVTLTDTFLEEASVGEPFNEENTLVTTSDRLLYLGICVVVAIIIAGLVVYFMIKSMNTARAVETAHDFVDKNAIKITNTSDRFLYSTLTKVAKPKPSTSSSSGGGSGGSRGGSGGKF